MFFKKRETEIDDDFEDDGFDDFDLDESGFGDTTPKTGLRAAVSTITGGFFSGLKSGVLDPNTHRKILKESLPDGYVAHYNDARDVLDEAKSIYNTASDEARKLKEEYAREIRPSVEQWDKASNSKLSNRVARSIGSIQRDDDGHEEPVSESQMAFNNSANDIFGTTLAQSTSEGVNELNASTQEGNQITQGLQRQTNTLLNEVSNTLYGQSAFNEQVALKWKKKTLEIQFKQYFTARKQLEIQTQSHEYMQAVLPNIVKNTALPDLVKTQTSEIAGQMLKQKWIGSLSDKVHNSFGEMVSGAGVNIKDTILAKAQEAMGGSSYVGSALGMFNNEQGFGQSPKEMALEFFGGMLGNSLIDYGVTKSTERLKTAADSTGIDFEKNSEALKQLKYQMPAILASMSQNGTGNEALDKLLEVSGLSSNVASRNVTVQTAFDSDQLADQAVFNIETQRSITYTIPALLSEIHGELSSVRVVMGGSAPDDDGKLRMDWTSGKLNTSKRIRRNLGDRLYSKDKSDSALETVYKMLGKFEGFDEDEIRADGEVQDKDGNVLLSSRDLGYLAVAVKTASFDRTKFFEIEDLARGSSLIRDPEARASIASFFKDQLEVDPDQESLAGTIDIVTAKRNMIARQNALKITQQNILEEARIEQSAAGIPEKEIADAIARGQVGDLMADGIVSIDKNGNWTIDPQALAERTQFAQKSTERSSEDMFGLKTNNKYGSEDRNRERLEKIAEQQARETARKEAEDKEKARLKEIRDNNGKSKAENMAADVGKWIGNKKEQTKMIREAGQKAYDEYQGKADAISQAQAEAAQTKIDEERLETEAATVNIPDAVVNGVNEGLNESTAQAHDAGLGFGRQFFGSLKSSINNIKISFQDGVTEAEKEIKEKKESTTDTAGNETEESTTDIAGNETEVKTPTRIRRVELGERRKRKRKDSPPYYRGKKAVPTKINYKRVDLNSEPTVTTFLNGNIPVTREQKEAARKEREEWREKVRADAEERASGNSFTEEQARDSIVLSSMVFSRIMNNVTTGQSTVPYTQGKYYTQAEGNFFHGGTITSRSGLIKNFAKGGKVKADKRYGKILDDVFKNIPPIQLPILNPNGAIQAPVDSVINPLKAAIDRETKAGGKPQVIVASENEEVLSTENGDAQTFRNFKQSGVWAKMKSHKEIYEDFDKNMFTREGKTANDVADMWNYNEQLAHPTGPNGTNIYDDLSGHVFKPTDAVFKPYLRTEETEATMKDLALTLVTEVKKLGGDVKQRVRNKFSDPEAMEGINVETEFMEAIGPTGVSGKIASGVDKLKELKALDNEETRAAMMGKLLGVKDFSADKLKAFSDMFDGEGEGIKMPGIGFGSKDKAVSTISHQIAELIRITGHVAINTGSTADDLIPADPSLISPYTPGKLDGSFFKSLKQRFKGKEKMEGIGEEEGESRWSRFKSKFKRNKPDTELDEVMSDEEIDESTPEGKKKGLMRRMLGGMFGLSWGTTKGLAKGGWWATKKSAAATWWATKKTGQATAWGAKGLFGGTEETNDVYLEGVKKPVMLARDMQEGKYLSAVDGKPILFAEDIKGAVLDEKGNFVITEEDFNNRRVFVHTNEGKQSLFVRGVKGLAGLSSTIMGGGIKAAWAVTKLPFQLAFHKFEKEIDYDALQDDGKITRDIYVKGDPDAEPVIRARLIGKGEYWTADKKPVETYSQLKDGVYNKEGNLILGPAELKKGLVTPDGNPLTKGLDLAGKIIGGTLSAGYKISSATFGLGFKMLKGAGSLLGKLTGGGFSLGTGAAKGLWSRLKGGAKDFDIDGIDKYALLLQAQAAAVDELAMIREIIDVRIKKPEGKFDDKDGDGHRDGSYMSTLRKKLEERKEKEAEKKRKAKEKMEGISAANEKKSMFAGLTESITSGISGFFSKGLMFAALGGLVAANFGPQIATGIFTGIRSVLPRWLGGYSQEKKDEIAANGGIIKNMITAGAAAREDSDGNRIATQPQVDAEGNPIPQELDENGNPVPTEEGTGGSGLSTSTKFALGAAATYMAPKLISKGVKGVAKAPGLLGTGIRLASNKVGLTAKLGLTGMGKAAAVKSIVKGGASGLGRAAMAGVRGAGALKGAVASHGIRGAAMAGLKALPALAATPVGMAVIAAVAVGLTVYAGYKLYKYLTRADNHLTTFRMAQYGYKIGDKNEVTKILDLEQYLAKFTVKATASTSAKLSVQADTKEVLKLFGVNENNQEDVDTFMDWFYYRFKPVYLTWKTLFARAVGKVTIEDVDKMLYISDKIKMVDDANFNREQLNPYDTMSSPFPSVEFLTLSHDEVLQIRDKVVKQLGKIDAEKHDAKVKSNGGGSKDGGVQDVASIENMTASAETPEIARKKREREKDKEFEETKRAAKREQQDDARRQKKEQGMLSKFMFGDKEKEAKGELSWGDKLNKKIGNFFGVGGGDGGEGGTYDASNKTLRLSQQDITDITKVTSTEAAEHLGQSDYNKQAGAIVDTIINRVVSKGYPDTVRGVINQSHQFSAISGNKGAYGSIQNMPDGATKPKARAFVPGYLKGLVDGSIKPVINGDLNYLNPAHSGQKALRTWGKIIIDQANKSGQIYGTGKSLHYHGTSTEMINKKPYGFKLAMGDKVSAPVGAGKKNTQKNGILGQSAQSTGGGNGGRGNGVPLNKNTKTKPSMAPGQGPMAVNSGTSAAPGVNLDMKAVTSKKDAGSTAKGPTTWQKVKNFHNELSGALSGAPSAAPVTLKDGSKVNMTPQQKERDGTSADPKQARTDGNLVAPEMTKSARPAKAAAYATKRALSDSIGYCAKYVREALKHAGYTGMHAGNGCPSAYMYATTGHLAKNGFKEIPGNSAPQLGDVGVTESSSSSKHGHIAIYNGSKWVSDFIHNSANPYRNKSLKVWMFRDAQFLDGAPVAADDGSFEASTATGSMGRPAYKMKLEKARADLDARKAKRLEIQAKAETKALKSTEVKIGFEGGRGLREIATKPDTSSNDNISRKLGLPQFGKLPESSLINYDTTPTGYVPKERVSKVKQVEDNGAIGNTVKAKRDAETIRLEHAQGEDERLAAANNAQKIREETEKQNQAQLKRLEKMKTAEVTTATEQKVIQEKQIKIAETDHGIYKQQLEVQISMAKDIRRMAETLDKMYAIPSSTGVVASAPDKQKSNEPAKPIEQNRHTQTNATNEPVSMKIR